MASSPRKSLQAIRIKPDLSLFKIKNNLRANSGVYSLTDVDPDSYDYEKIYDLIDNDAFIINNIQRINNPFLMRSYMVKKEEKFELYDDVEERLLFHGTKHHHLDNICQYNFDWRHCDRHKFGHGISFTPDAKYAMHYSDKCKDKIMIVAKVLISNSINGHENMIIPPNGYDTSCKPNGDVIVKYEDNEYYPEFIVDYRYEKKRRNYNNYNNGGYRSNYNITFNFYDYDDDDYDDYDDYQYHYYY